MRYEELRKQFIDQQKDIARRNRLLSLIESGELSTERAKACKQEVARLMAVIDARDDFFKYLESTKNPIWMKMTRELDATLREYGTTSTSIGQMIKKFCGTMAVLILGTQMIDGLRRR